VGTGLESRIALDSRSLILAEADGMVEYVDAKMIIVKYDQDDHEKILSFDSDTSTYELTKFRRTNQDTSVNLKPTVLKGDRVVKGQPLCHGFATEHGELALGRNLQVAYMPWQGYNFEDAIVISDRVVREDVFTSIHIDSFELEVRDTKRGLEELTSEIPNVSEEAVKNLDEDGIIRIGAEITEGDIMIGKITPKGESDPTPEEKLLRAIFGEKASDVKDTSLRVPSSINGTVIGVEVFTRDGMEKDERTISIESDHLAVAKKDNDDQIKIINDATRMRLIDILKGKKVSKGIAGILKRGATINPDDLSDISLDELMSIRVRNDIANNKVEETEEALEKYLKNIRDSFEEKKQKITRGHDLAPGVIKIVKVYLAVKRRIQPGDKMAGRHGNKGVISEIMPIEDMPHDSDGNPVDIVLNPLGVPSRMNVGQILETHMGAAAKGIGEKINKMIDMKVKADELTKYLDILYNKNASIKENLGSLNNSEIFTLANNLIDGLPIATPVFDGAKERQTQE
jgi:DNA-directed RNA polymerase subunit beta